MKTYSARSETIDRSWVLIDANDISLGRLASEVAFRLRGKHRPEFTPHVDTGDFVVVVNADKVRVTGRKMKQKIYYSHTGYPGGLKEITLEKLMQKDATEVIFKAVRGMLPKNSLGRDLLRKLRVYVGPEHEQVAQQPQTIEIKDKVF